MLHAAHPLFAHKTAMPDWMETVDTTLLEYCITPRDAAARQDLARAQADVQAALEGLAGVTWRYNDVGAQAVIIAFPADQLAEVRVRLHAHYMVDPNQGLRPI